MFNIHLEMQTIYILIKQCIYIKTKCIKKCMFIKRNIHVDVYASY